MLIWMGQKRGQPLLSRKLTLVGAVLVGGLHFAAGLWFVRSAYQPPAPPAEPEPYLAFWPEDEDTAEGGFYERLRLFDSAALLLPAQRRWQALGTDETLPEPFAPFPPVLADRSANPAPSVPAGGPRRLLPGQILERPPDDVYGQLVRDPAELFHPVAAPVIEIRDAASDEILQRRPLPAELGAEPALEGLWPPLVATFLVDPVGGVHGPVRSRGTGQAERDELILGYLASEAFRLDLPPGNLRVTVGK